MEPNTYRPPFSWFCPFCNRDTTINNNDFSSEEHVIRIKTIHGNKIIVSNIIVCPNPDCKEYSLIIQIFNYTWGSGSGIKREKLEKQLTIIPAFKSKIFPEFIPQQIRNDYYEACQVKEISPKASATLSRRCLQGMIRDFWKISKGRLFDEISELENRVDPLTWQAINSVRKIGNISAHMEKDVNMIIDVEPEEAELLIGLVENLLHDWYIVRNEREKRLQQIVELGNNKEELRKK